MSTTQKIQALIDAGATPETHPVLQGLVKLTPVPHTFPGPRGQLCKGIRLALVPDTDAIQARVNSSTATPAPGRFQCLEVSQ